MLNDIYNDRILKFAADIPCSDRLEAPDATATAVSRLCGSKVTVDLCLDGDKVAAFGQDVKACALGQASSSIMGHHILGKSADELHRVAGEMRRMLKENGPAPEGEWEDLAILEPVRDYKARHASTLLIFDAVEEALDKALAAHNDSSTEGGTGDPAGTLTISGAE